MSSKQSSSKKYSKLKRITLSKDILQNDAAIYSSSFAAIAELVDNSKDANAHSFHIYTIPTKNYLLQYGLCFLDDGHGMSPNALEEAICYGKSIKRSADKIGQFGVGLKSSTMRLASNMILFTKHISTDNTIYSILLLSDTFNTQIDELEPVVAMPSFTQTNDLLIPYYSSQSARETFKDEIDLIFKYSPFQNINQLKEQFDMINSPTGTLVICYDLKFSSSSQSELLKIDYNNHDIKLNDYSCSHEDSLKFENESLRAYLSILYHTPTMKIYILNKKVKTKLIVYSMAYIKRVEHEVKSLDKLKLKEVKTAEDNVKRAQNELNDTQNKKNANKFESLKALFVKQCQRAQENLDQVKNQLEIKKKELKLTTKIDIVYGLNIDNRFSDGFFVYYNNRLILMYDKPSKNKLYDGIFGVVNLPYNLLEINKSKQGFAENMEYKKLFKTLCENYTIYEARVRSELQSKYNQIDKFWDYCGYSIENYKNGLIELPNDTKLVKNGPSTARDFRLKNRYIYIQCDECLKWRLQTWTQERFSDINFPSDGWKCTDNQCADTHLRNKCTDSECFKEIQILRELRSAPEEIRLTQPTSSGTSTNCITSTTTSTSKTLSLRQIVYSPLNKKIKMPKPLLANKNTAHKQTKNLTIKSISRNINLNVDSSSISSNSRSGSPVVQFSKRTQIETENVEPRQSKRIRQNININNNNNNSNDEEERSSRPTKKEIDLWFNTKEHHRKLLIQIADLYETSLTRHKEISEKKRIKNFTDQELFEYEYEKLFDMTINLSGKNQVNYGIQLAAKEAYKYIKDPDLLNEYKEKVLNLKKNRLN